MALSDEDKKWISTEIAKQVKAGIDAACKLVAFDDEEGGSGSQIGQAVLNSGYPKTSGAKRSAFWANQRDQQNDLNEVLSRLPELPAN